MEADGFQQQAQIDLATKFYDNLQTGKKPEWDGSEHTYQAVRYQHPQIDDNEVDLGTLGLQLRNAQAMADESNAQFNLLKSMVMDTLGYAKVGYVLDNGNKVKVASRQSRRDGIPFLVVHK